MPTYFLPNTVTRVQPVWSDKLAPAGIVHVRRDHLVSSFCPNSLMVSVALSAAFPMAVWVCLPASEAASETKIKKASPLGRWSKDYESHMQNINFSFMILLL